MKFVAVDIRNFRSVKDGGIKNIDNFNVFIGKNNSGKSNLLSAIHAFFQILSNDSLESSNPVIGNTLPDFTQKNTTDPISIAARFGPSRDEMIKMRRLI